MVCDVTAVACCVVVCIGGSELLYVVLAKLDRLLIVWFVCSLMNVLTAAATVAWSITDVNVDDVDGFSVLLSIVFC